MNNISNEQKYKPGTDYQTICFLADYLGDEYKCYKDAVKIKAWGKRFSFDPMTGDIVKIQAMNKNGTFTTIGKADDYYTTLKKELKSMSVLTQNQTMAIYHQELFGCKKCKYADQKAIEEKRACCTFSGHLTVSQNGQTCLTKDCQIN